MDDTNQAPNGAQRGAQPRESASQDFAGAINDPDHPIVRDALGRKCDQCHANIGAECQPRGGIRHDLAGRLIHLGRMDKP